MKTILLHGLGQTAQDWDGVLHRLSPSTAECPELFGEVGEDRPELSYGRLLSDLEKRYAGTEEPLLLCGLSLGAVLAIDFAVRHNDKVASLVLIGAQYKMPGLLIDLQNLIFRCMPGKAFSETGISKRDMIRLTHSMRTLDFTGQLSGITCPVTILCGEKDCANLRASRKLCGMLAQPKLRIVPGAGHELNKCAPDEIAAALR
ncbi:MAG TPA: alpha/beta hydrolase [Candidatus Eisenbergiella intestinipullorum]|nr:alpha/beta hydrolase [Candidatus Eisenbergiella intestinipullorum]